jgi:hypothetical protein
MRALKAIMVLCVVLGGCDLFKKVELYSAVQDANEACGDFCASWVHATYDCIESSDLCVGEVSPEGDSRSSCKDECVEISEGIDDENELDKIVECMWCVVDELGTEPDCTDFYEDQWSMIPWIAECEYECSDVETLLNKFDWWEDLLDQCWMPDYY